MKDQLIDWLLKIFVSRFSWFVRWWYSLTMKWTLRGAKNVEIPKLPSANDIHKKLDFESHYKMDPLDGKLDYLAHPRLIEKRIRLGKFVDDCDGHGIYWATVLLKSGLAAKVWFCSVQYKRPDKRGGHVICVWEDHDEQLWWADYGFPQKIYNQWGWLDRYHFGHNTSVIGAMMIPVTGLDENDTPKFGKDVLTWVS